MPVDRCYEVSLGYLLLWPPKPCTWINPSSCSVRPLGFLGILWFPSCACGWWEMLHQRPDLTDPFLGIGAYAGLCKHQVLQLEFLILKVEKTIGFCTE